MMKGALMFLAVLALVLVSCAGGNATATIAPVPAEYAGKTNPLDANSTVPGGEIFQTNCSACHGDQGHGDGPAGAALDPRPKNLAEFAPTVNDDYLFWRINTGVPGTSMVGWKGVLTDEQIWQVVSFIRTLKP